MSAEPDPTNGFGKAGETPKLTFLDKDKIQINIQPL